MIKIKFIGKSIEDGEWVCGYYGIKGEGTDLEEHFIMVSTLQTNTSIPFFYFTDVKVIPETVLQINKHTMTPKEKANQIISRYKGFACKSCYGKESNIITAKQCAEIAVDEIALNLSGHHQDAILTDFIDYWQAVKEEIRSFS